MALDSVVLTDTGLPARKMSLQVRVYEHVRNYASQDDGVSAPWSLTQDGIAQALGSQRNKISPVLKTLVLRGSVSWAMRHLRDAPVGTRPPVRRRVYLPASGQANCQGRMLALSEYVLRSYGTQGAVYLIDILKRRV